MRSSKHWLIWSMEHCAWWKPNKNGYTTLTHKAGRYTMGEAVAIVNEANWQSTEEYMVPAPSLDQCKLDMEHPDR